MSESISYDPFNTRKSAAYATVNILAVLDDGQYHKLSQIQADTRLPDLHRGRLLEHMKHLEEMKFVESWNDLTKEKQKDYKTHHRSFDPKGVTHIYKITSDGKTKFVKVRNDCLQDEGIQHILRARINEPNN